MKPTASCNRTAHPRLTKPVRASPNFYSLIQLQHQLTVRVSSGRCLDDLIHEEKNGDSSYTERRFGSFSRVVRLPFETGEGQVDAKFGNGVLTVRIPKPAQLQRAVRRIEVRAA